MREKSTTSENDPMKFDVPFVPEKSSRGDDVEATKSKSHQRSNIRRTVKLPRLKLADLVSQITKENAHGEISIGEAVGNEVW